MSVYLDTSQPGGPGPLNTSGQVFYFGAETDFYLSVASNLIAGQATGPSVQFQIQSHRTGVSSIQCDYGTTNTSFPVKYTGYLIVATVPTGGNPVSCRVVVSSLPFPLSVITVPPTLSGSVSVTGTVATDLGQQTLGAIDPRIMTINTDNVGLARKSLQGTDGSLVLGTSGGTAIDPRLNKPQLASPGPATVLETHANPEYQQAGTSSVFTIQFGSVTITKGAYVTYNLFVAPLGTPSAGQYPIIFLVGHTSGTLYAFAIWGGNQASSQFYMPESEKLDVQGYNGELASQMGYSWQAVTP